MSKCLPFLPNRFVENKAGSWTSGSDCFKMDPKMGEIPRVWQVHSVFSGNAQYAFEIHPKLSQIKKLYS